jgi:hypothetical protein
MKGSGLMIQGKKTSLEEELRQRGVRGVLLEMAKNGQLLELKCEMPVCYCEKGRTHFDSWPSPRRASAAAKWAPNPDHYPTLRRDGGERKSWNTRLAHVHCNNMDIGWRSRIRAMLEKKPTLSFYEIAEALNRKQTVLLPPKKRMWTANLVRTLYVS